MEEITDAIDRAAPEHFTQALPKSAQAQMRALVKAAKGDKKAVADRLGVDPNTVRRYLKGERKHPRSALREALARELQKVWQPGIRRQARKKAASSTGITVEVWAYFGYTAPVGTTDEPRLRHLTVHLPRSGPTASSPPRTRAPATNRCATSWPRDSRRCISRTADHVRRTSKSNSPEFKQSTCPTDPGWRNTS